MPRLTRSLFAGAVSLAFAAAMPAAAQTISATDSALVGRILLAEDRRDANDPALGEGAAHADPRIQVIARRAAGRIADPKFAARDSIPRPAAPPSWPEPSWRLRYRALAERRDDCGALRAALGDSTWQVRLRVAQIVRPSCARDSIIVRTFEAWIRQIPGDASKREQGRIAWQAAGNGFVALSRVRPDLGSRYVKRLAANRNWHLRQYAARGAGLLADSAMLRELANDKDDNVAEAAIEGLARVTGHGSDGVYLAALDRDGAQPVQAAAIALKGSPRPEVPAAAMRVFEKWVARANASERDVREALLLAAGRTAAEDRAPVRERTLPADAVALALGRDVRLRVTMDDNSGGGGTFEVRLRGDVAPIMAARILALAESGYYDGLTWHRVEHDFVIQGGSPGANEYVGLPDFLRDELGTVTHARGTLGMSTRGHDTGDAQWFVNLRDNARLDVEYTVWGEIVSGIPVVDAVLEGDVIRRIRVIR